MLAELYNTTLTQIVNIATVLCISVSQLSRITNVKPRHPGNGAATGHTCDSLCVVTVTMSLSDM